MCPQRLVSVVHRTAKKHEKIAKHRRPVGVPEQHLRSSVSRNDPIQFSLPFSLSLSKYKYNGGVRLTRRRFVCRRTQLRYIEKYEKDDDKLDQVPSEALAGLVALGLKLSQLQEFTGRENPTVIT